MQVRVGGISPSNMNIRHVIHFFVALFFVVFGGMLLQWGISHHPSWEAGLESGMYPREVLNQTYEGVVLSMKDVRFNHTRNVLKTLGIHAVQKVPPSFESKEVDQGLENYVGSRVHHDPTFLKVWSNRMAFIDAVEAFVLDTSTVSGHKTWRFFFEDDIALHPSLSVEEAKLVLARGLALASEDGFVFLGICSPTCTQVQNLDRGVQAARCAGTCAHAFGFQQWKAAEFLTEMSGLTISDPNPAFLGIYFDRYLYTFGQVVHKIWVVGSNLKSPVGTVSDHFGMLYQDRDLFHSEISI